MEVPLRKLPVGIQSFEYLRTNDFLYVDKTEYVYKLANVGKPYFLGRPRRFGKSLFLSTLKAYFEGKKELFAELKITELEKDWTQYPVFYIDLNRSGFNSLESLVAVLEENLSIIEEKWGKFGGEKELSTRFSFLIRKVAEQTGKKVVVLIDEYDKPLTATMDDADLNKKMRKILKGFYGVLKAEDENLRFVFLTGVTKFSKVSVFSDLNQLNDISLDEKYAEICGITELELLKTFQPEIQALAAKQKMSFEETFSEMKKNYDGYHFHPLCQDIYNPFSVLNTLDKQDFGYYWFETGTPTFLAKMVKDQKIKLREFSDNDFAYPADEIMQYRMNPADPIPLLYQTGYLTIKGYNRQFEEYMLGYPNREVWVGFVKELAMLYMPATTVFGVREFCRDLIKGDVEQFMKRLQTFFADISYDLNNKTEKDFQTIFYLLFKLMGQFVKAEEHSAAGSCDAVVEMDDVVYVFEFKLDTNATAKAALRQIEEKNYSAKYKLSGKKIVKIGVVFDTEKRTVGEWEYEQ